MLILTFFSRPKKGFDIPVEHWLRTDMFEWMRDFLLSTDFNSRGLFNRNGIEVMIEEHKAGINHSNRLWALICLELWFQKFVD